MRIRLAACAVTVVTVLAGCARAEPAPLPGDPTPPTSAFDASVVRVVDGDTLLARRAGDTAAERVRLIGVDAPESVAPDRPVGCFGPAASVAAKRLLPRGARLRVATEPGGDRDRYGRLLWDVWLPDGRFLQAVLVRAGAARADPVAPQTAYAGLLAALERQARADHRGLWGAC